MKSCCGEDKLQYEKEIEKIKREDQRAGAERPVGGEESHYFWYKAFGVFSSIQKGWTSKKNPGQILGGFFFFFFFLRLPELGVLYIWPALFFFFLFVLGFYFSFV
jgi:hypothetical protein